MKIFHRFFLIVWFSGLLPSGNSFRMHLYTHLCVEYQHTAQSVLRDVLGCRVGQEDF